MNRDFIVKERGSGPLPRHIAIIMDGNGRWAKERGLPRIAGHEKGSEVVKHAVQACNELQIEYLMHSQQHLLLMKIPPINHHPFF